MTSSQNAAMMVKWGELWEGDIAIADDLVSDDFVTHVAPLPWAADVGKTAGREALKEWISGGVRLLIPDLHFSVDVGPIADQHYMVVRWKLEGTYNGAVPGSSPNAIGRRVAFTGTDIVRIEDGKFAEYWLNADNPVLHAADRTSRCHGAGLTVTPRGQRSTGSEQRRDRQLTAAGCALQ